jgi:hypothetical protein
LTDELYQANQTINFLSTITGQNPDLIKSNLHHLDAVEPSSKELKKSDSALTLKKSELDPTTRFVQKA